VRVVRIVTRANRGGPLRQLQALVPGLARAGVEGPVWVGEPAAGETDCADLLRAAGAEVVRVPGLRRAVSPAADARVWRWMRSRLRRERPDVVHTHLAKAGALGRLAARAAHVPVVVHTFHGHHLTARLAARTAARLAERRLARATTAAVCLSESQRRDLVERFGVLPPEKAVVVGPGIDVDALRASVDPERVARLRAGLVPEGGVLFVWLGRFVDVKDPGGAVSAFLRARAGGTAPPLRLAMLGEGPLRAASMRSAGPSGGSATFTGEVDDPQHWIAAADAVVLSSRSEGTPIAAVEAACLGVPVVATAVGGVADVVRDGETGVLVPPPAGEALGVAMRRLALDPALRARLGERARRDAEARFCAARLVSETAALYVRLLGEVSRSRAGS
jgi:glycosyltransferase involved in cell wall biosynthesis